MYIGDICNMGIPISEYDPTKWVTLQGGNAGGVGRVGGGAAGGAGGVGGGSTGGYNGGSFTDFLNQKFGVSGGDVFHVGGVDVVGGTKSVDPAAGAAGASAVVPPVDYGTTTVDTIDTDMETATRNYNVMANATGADSTPSTNITGYDVNTPNHKNGRDAIHIDFKS